MLTPEEERATEKSVRRALEKRAKKHARTLNRFMEHFEGEHPNLFSSTLLEFLYNGLRSLRHYIEDPEEKRISWADPWVELQYPVEWNWEKDGWITAHWTLEDLKEETFKKKTLGETAYTQHLLSTLHFFTRGARYRKQGNNLEPELPLDVLEELEKLSEEGRRTAFDEFFEPFTLGGKYIDPGDLEDGKAVTEGGKAKLREAWEDAIGFFGDVGGSHFSGSIVLAFHPLVIDEDAREVYYPIVVGLQFAPLEQASGEEEGLTFPNPEEWRPEERAAFWDELLQVLEKLGEELGAHGEETGERDEKGTIIPGKGVAPPVAVAPAPERRGVFPASFGPAMVDRDASDFLRHAHKLRLPAKSWGRLKSWEELQEEEISRILEEVGEEAFLDLRKETGDRGERGPLLKRRYRKGEEERIGLAAEGTRRLKISAGAGKGFRYTDEYGKEYLTRLFQAGRGYLEVGLSWFGLAGPWVEGWRNDLKKGAEKDRQGSLFENLDEQRQIEIERRLRRLRMLEDGRDIMEMIHGQVGRQSRNPISIPAIVFRILLGLEKDPNWKARVEGGLEALRACEFRLDSFGMEKKKAYGSFLGEWRYIGAGPGAHGDGEYLLFVLPGFLGCLQFFESGKYRLPSGVEVARYDFGKQLTETEKKALGWGYDPKKRKRRRAISTYAIFDAGRVFYNAVEGLSAEQKNLVDWVEREITLRRDTAARGWKSVQVKKTATDALKPRQYGPDFCPLLPGGKLYHGALGHFIRSPETGRTLYGTETRETKTGGAHKGGLISVLGYLLPPGGASQKRAQVVQNTLEDLKAVVVDYLGGTVAAKLKNQWLTLDEVSRVDYNDLTRKACFFLFLPETWKADRRKRWEEKTGFTATESPEEATKAGEAHREGRIYEPAENVGVGGLPLRHRLRVARKDRGLTQKEAGMVFGVSQKTVATWELGTDRGESGKPRGKPIPRTLAPLIERWIETEERPTPEELQKAREKKA